MDMLDRIANEVERTIDGGYYGVKKADCKRFSLADNIRKRNFALISEIKPCSPSAGRLFEGDVEALAKEMANGGAAAISVLTEPVFFEGALENITMAKKTALPVLMKDFILDTVQIEGGKNAGADAVLLILSLFERGRANTKIDEMIGVAHKMDVEVFLEVHSIEEFRKAKETNADVIGINNRDLGTLGIDINTTLGILKNEIPDRPVISESGIGNRDDILLMQKAGANGVLVGTSILKAGDVSKKEKELLGG